MSEASETERIERVRVVTRGYEVSPNGRIGVAQFLRYVEHTRWRTIAHSDRIPARSFMRLGVVRAQQVDIFEDVSFDVELEVSMWISRVGNTSMDFSHDVVRVSDGKLVAQSSATVVMLDHARRPAKVDSAAHRYVVDRKVSPIERLGGEVPASAFELPIVVRPSDQDLQQHVNHARYADYVEDTRELCAAAGGYGSGSFDGPARSMTISYEDEARVGDPLRAVTFVAEPGGGVLDFLLLKDERRVTTRARVRLSPREGGAR